MAREAHLHAGGAGRSVAEAVCDLDANLAAARRPIDWHGLLQEVRAHRRRREALQQGAAVPRDVPGPLRGHHELGQQCLHGTRAEAMYVRLPAPSMCAADLHRAFEEHADPRPYSNACFSRPLHAHRKTAPANDYRTTSFSCTDVLRAGGCAPPWARGEGAGEGRAPVRSGGGPARGGAPLRCAWHRLSGRIPSAGLGARAALLCSPATAAPHLGPRLPPPGTPREPPLPPVQPRHSAMAGTVGTTIPTLRYHHATAVVGYHSCRSSHCTAS